MAIIREDLQKLNTKIMEKVRVIALKRAAIDQVVTYFCKVLKYVGEFWELNHAWMEKMNYNDPNDMETKLLEKIVEAVFATLDGQIRTGNPNVVAGKDGNEDHSARISMYEKSVTGPRKDCDALVLSFQVLSYIAIEANSSIGLSNEMAKFLPSETKVNLSGDDLQKNPRMLSPVLPPPPPPPPFSKVSSKGASQEPLARASQRRQPIIAPQPPPASAPPPFSKLSSKEAAQDSPAPGSQGRQPVIAPPAAPPPPPFSKLSSRGAAQEHRTPASQGTQPVIAPPPPPPPAPPPPPFSKLSSKGAAQDSPAPASQGKQSVMAPPPPPVPPPPPFSKLPSKGAAQESSAPSSQGRQPIIAPPPAPPPPQFSKLPSKGAVQDSLTPASLGRQPIIEPPPLPPRPSAPPLPPPPPQSKVSTPSPAKMTPSVQAQESVPRTTTKPNAPQALTTPTPPPAPPKSTPSLTKGQPPPPPPPVPKNPGTMSVARPPPPPPQAPSAKAATTPPPPPSFATTKLAYSKKATTKLKRSTQIANLYRLLKGKMEGSQLDDTSKNTRKGQLGGATGAQAGMADSIAEMTKRSAYFQQIAKDVEMYAKQINVLKAELSSFRNKDMTELIDFRNYLESFLEKLTDESQVLGRFEGFPMQKLEAVRASAALYLKLEAFLIDLGKWKVEPPLDKLLEQIESYFSKMKREIDTFERMKDEELKKFQRQNIYFDLQILVRIKEQMMDVSSSCMELALKEKREEKKVEEREVGRDAKGKADQKHTKMLWRAFQFAFRVYTFAGGIDERADMLTKHLAHEIQTYVPSQ